jgi:hypothetical protein
VKPWAVQPYPSRGEGAEHQQHEKKIPNAHALLNYKTQRYKQKKTAVGL